MECKTAYLNEGYVRDHVTNGDISEIKTKGKAATIKDDNTVIPIVFTVDDHYPAVKKKGDEAEEEDDPWALPELHSTDTPWSELTTWGKTKRATWYFARFIILLALLYSFICSLDILSSAFRLLGGKAAGEALSNTVLFSNPIAGVMLGVLATVLVQSSSTSTSIIVSMVSAGMLKPHMAIPIVMGANIGTTITNTIVAVGQSADRGDFRRAFAAATVHDMFNWLSVLVFLPLEWVSRYLYHLSDAMVQGVTYDPASSSNPEFLKAITQPLTDKVVKLSSSKIRDIAMGKNVNGSLMTGGDHIFSNWSLSDTAAGGILLAVSLFLLCLCLVLIVKLLSSLLRGTIATVLQKFINSDLPGPARHLTGYLAILIGAGLTMLVQSSSIFTSALTPLVGIGAIHIDRMYPLTLGSNIGTTVTGILAALASDASGFKESMQVALCHLFFNISGILLWYPIPFMRRVPLSLAKKLGNTVHSYRWFALLYLVFMYFLLPVAVFGLSLAGWEVLLGVGLPIVLFIVAVVVINLLQDKRPQLLPAKLRSWTALGVPEALRSLQPYDRVIVRMRAACRCCTKTTPEEEAEVSEPVSSSSKDSVWHKPTANGAKAYENGVKTFTSVADGGEINRGHDQMRESQDMEAGQCVADRIETKL